MAPVKTQTPQVANSTSPQQEARTESGPGVRVTRLSNQMTQRLVARGSDNGVGPGGSLAGQPNLLIARTLGPSAPTLTLPASLQAQLRISQPADPSEQEADRIAESVIRMPEPGPGHNCTCGESSTGTTQNGSCCGRKAGHTVSRSAAAGAASNAAPGIVTDVLSSPGQPLDTATRDYMEPRFGHDFGAVRVHTDSKAARSATAIDAHAYTVGHDIVFAAGQYAPASHHGRKLLAHELTHTVQQTAGGVQRCGDHTSPGCLCAEELPEPQIQRDFFDDAAEAASGLAQGAVDTASETASAVGDAASAAAGAVSDAASAAAGAVSDAASAAAGAAGEAVDWLATTAGQAALDGANALAGLFGGAVVIRGGCLIVTIPEIPLFPSFQKTLGETPEYGFFIPIIAGGTMVGPIPLAGTFGILGYAQGSIEAAIGPGMIRGIRVEICPFAGRVLATGQLYAAAAIGPRLTLFGGLAAAAGTIIPFDPPIPVIVILQGGLRGRGTAWFIGAIQDTVTLAYSAGTLSFDNVTDLMGGVLLQGDVDLFAALRLYTKIICQYVYPLGYWETGAAWKLSIPIHAGLSGSGGTGGVGPITFGPMPIQDIVTAIQPLATGLNCLSWEEIKQFLCENGILPPELCQEEEGEEASGLAGSCIANDNLGEIADGFIGRCRQASIRREFPGEMLNETLGNIKRGTTARHKKAWKLLNENRFKKPGAAATPTGCPIPIKFKETAGGDAGNGVLFFKYAWESSTGNLADLKDCEVDEIVSYPGPNPFVWPRPPWDGKTKNPEVGGAIPGTDGKMGDEHTTRSFLEPYKEASFTATQFYRFRTKCHKGGAPENLKGPLSIVRTVKKRKDGKLKYTVTKSGKSASIDPMP